MITTFRVQNYKALRDVSLQLTPMHLLIGPNDSGKTSIMEALAALSRMTTMDADQSFGGDWQGRELVWNSSDTPLKLSVSCSNGAKSTLEVCFAETGRSASFPGTINPHRPLTSEISEREFRTREELRESIERIRDAVSPVELFAFIPSWMSLPCAADIESDYKLDTTGFGLPRCLNYLLGRSRTQFNELESRLLRIFPQLSEIVLMPEKGMKFQRGPSGDFALQYSNEGTALYFRIRDKTTPISARQMSQGILIVLALLTILYLPDPPRLLLIEEPENAIHPEQLDEIVDILRDLLKEHHRTQVVMTSHSPYIVSLFEPNEVTLCHKNDQGEVQVKRLSDSQIVKDQLRVFSLGEIWPAEEERIFKESNDAIPAPAEAIP